MTNNSILCVGDSTVDRFFTLDSGEAELLSRHNEREIAFKYGEKISVETYNKSYGGSALNTSIGFARLGFEAKVATIVGEDTDGGEMINFLALNGVGKEFVLREGESNQSAIVVFKGERTIFSYHKRRNYENLALPSANWIYWCSTGDGFEKLIDKILDATLKGSMVAMNPGSSQLKNFKDLGKILENCKVLFLNKSEAEMLFEKAKISELLDEMIGLGSKVAVITDGANGAYVADSKSRLHMGIAPSSLVDPTGAGDSFACAFLAAYTNNRSLEESCRWGMLNSASVVGKIGASSGLLSREEIVKRQNETQILKATQL